jgi:preprotein translocase subunit YajC
MRIAMKMAVAVVAVAGWMVLPVRATDDVVSAIHGTITKVDAATRTAVVKTADGTEHTIHFVDRTAVHGAEATATGAKDAFHGLKEGSEVAVHYTAKGTEKTAVEVDHLGKDGIKSVDGAVTKVGEGGKTVTVKAADGTEQTFDVVSQDTKEAAEAVGKGADKSAKVTVYYTESAGKKVAHFFKKL